MKYSKSDIQAFQKFYTKISEVCCPECMAEADSALQVIKHYFCQHEILPILQERSRCEALGLGESEARLRIRRVTRAILERMAVDLTW